jgi:streptogramin lyase
LGRITPSPVDAARRASSTVRPYVRRPEKGVPFVCDFGTNKIVEVNPDTLAIKEYPLPNEDSRPRRIAISRDDVV